MPQPKFTPPRGGKGGGKLAKFGSTATYKRNLATNTAIAAGNFTGTRTTSPPRPNR